MKILSKPKGNAEEYGRWSVNSYIGCSHGCKYCYLKAGPSGKYLGQDHPILKKGVVDARHAYYLAMTEIIEHRHEILRDGGLFFSFTSDPCHERERNLNFTIAHDAMRRHIPVTFLTKSEVQNTHYIHATTFQIMQLPNPKQELVGQYAAFGWTLTGCDDLEPYAPTNSLRVDSMNRLHTAGYKVWASLEPIIDFQASLRMFRYALNAGCSHFKIGLLTNRTRVAISHYIEKYGDQFKGEVNQFIDNIQKINKGYNVPIYWKESIRSIADRDLTALPNAVGKEWSMFN